MTGFSPWLAGITPTLIVILGAIGTLGLFTLLYRENPVYRYFEHAYLGLATGYLVATSWNDVVLPKLWKPMLGGQWIQVFALTFCLGYYFIFSKRMAWIARLCIGVVMGIIAGRAFTEFANDVWPQIPATFKPLLPHAAHAAAGAVKAIPAVSWADAVNNLLFMAIVFAVMVYFFFSIDHKSAPVRASAAGGRWVMMVAFGAIFGSTMMARLALLIDRVDYLINDLGDALMPHSPATAHVVMFLCLMGLAALLVVLARRDPQTAVAPSQTPTDDGS